MLAPFPDNIQPHLINKQPQASYDAAVQLNDAFNKPQKEMVPEKISKYQPQNLTNNI